MYIIATCVAVVVILWFLQGQRRPPGTLPFAGNGLWFLQPRHKLLEWFVQCERQVGFDTYEISVPSLPPGIVINDPANVEHVLKNNDLFIKGDFFRTRSWDLFGNGIINADGHLWKIQRKAGLRFFSNANLKTFIDEILPPVIADTEQNLEEAVQEGTQVDLQSILLELTTRLMGNMAYDTDMPASLPFSKAFDFASGATGERFQNPFWKLKEYFFGARFRKAVYEVKKFGNELVFAAVHKRHQAKEAFTIDEPAGTDPSPNNLINSLLDHIEDRQVVADAAMNYLSAGRDTTAQSLTWTFYLLMRNPSARERIINHLQHVSTSDLQLPLSFDSIQSSAYPYIAAVFNESLRLYPPVPVELKECTAPTTFPDGTWLPKGAVVMWATWAMGRSQNIWGDDANKFRPERWLVPGDSLALTTKSAFEFPVFNGGPRSCLGKRMAELLAIHVIASLSWKFEFKEAIDGAVGLGNTQRERQSQNSLTLPMEGGLPCYVRRRIS